MLEYIFMGEPYRASLGFFVGKISRTLFLSRNFSASLSDGSGCWIRMIRMSVLRRWASHLLLIRTNLGYGTVLRAACAHQGCNATLLLLLLWLWLLLLLYILHLQGWNAGASSRGVTVQKTNIDIFTAVRISLSHTRVSFFKIVSAFSSPLCFRPFL
jgi:hypothetical protein